MSWLRLLVYLQVVDLSSYELEFKERENRIQFERMLLTKSYFPLYTSSICISSVQSGCLHFTLMCHWMLSAFAFS